MLNVTTLYPERTGQPSVLEPPPVAAAHQHNEDFLPVDFYQIYEEEFRWQYHVNPPYA